MSVLSASDQIVFEFARAASIDGWWLWALLICSLGLLIFGCVRFYRRDAAELPRTVNATLIFLRLSTIIALIFFFFDLQRRTQREISRPSEVAVLLDASQSMSLAESDAPDSPSRIATVIDMMKDVRLSERLGVEHRVSVYSFGESAEPILLEARGMESGGGNVAEAAPTESSEALPNGQSVDVNATDVSPFAVLGMLLVAFALLASMAALIVGAAGRTAVTNSHTPASESLGFFLMLAAPALCLGIAVAGSAYSVRTQQSFYSMLGLQQSPSSSGSEEDSEEEFEELPDSIKVLDWSEAIAASASQSRISDAISSILASHDPTTLAGIVILTDGQNNGGTNIASAVSIARRSEIAVYPLGLGSSTPPTNVRVVDLDAPKRVYPNDKFSVSAVLQATGGNDLKIDVQLLDGLEESRESGQVVIPSEVVDTQTVTLTGDGSLGGVKFELEPKSVGRRRLAVRVVAPANDQNQKDNLRDARYEVVTRKLRVLVVAGGPTREYRFVRNLLFSRKVDSIGRVASVRASRDEPGC